MRYRRFARAVFGSEELEQIERVAEWRGRPADWEIVDELRRQLGSARNGKSRPRLRPFDYGHAEDDEGRPADPALSDEGAGDPAELAARRDEVARCRRLVAALPPRLRRVAEMRLDGAGHRQIATELKCSVDRVWQLWTQVKANLAAPKPRKPTKLELDERRKAARIAAVRPLAVIEREAIEAALRATCGDVRHAARLLKIGRATVYRKLEIWGVSPSAYAEILGA